MNLQHLGVSAGLGLALVMVPPALGGSPVRGGGEVFMRWPAPAWPPRPSIALALDGRPPAQPPAPRVRAVRPQVTKVSPTHGVSPASAPPDATTLPPFPLTFDAETKEALVKPGDTNAFYVFRLTNTSPSAVVVDRVWTSCGCTAARLPSLPWVLAPEADGQIEVELDLRGKRGILSKSVYLYTPSAFKILTVNATVPDPMMAGLTDRLRNMQAAAADRQAVFRADCAPCHAEPGKGKLGRELFQAVCAICHEAEHRATRVPDLRALDHPPDAEHWRQWIRQGKTGTLMPAFAQAEGGPLTDEQVRSLVEYLGARDPARWPVPPPAPPPARP